MQNNSSSGARRNNADDDEVARKKRERRRQKKRDREGGAGGQHSHSRTMAKALAIGAAAVPAVLAGAAAFVVAALRGISPRR